MISGKTVLDAPDFGKEAGVLREPDSNVLSFSGLTLDELEKQRILHALDATDGNLSHTAVVLGISRAALYRRLEKYDIRTDTKRGR